MTFTDLHKILDDENHKLSLDELKQVIYEMKQDCFKETAVLLDDYSNKRCGERHYIHTNAYYMGEKNAFQIVLDLLEHCNAFTPPCRLYQTLYEVKKSGIREWKVYAVIKAVIQDGVKAFSKTNPKRCKTFMLADNPDVTFDKAEAERRLKELKENAKIE